MMVDDLSGFAPADIGLGSCLQSVRIYFHILANLFNLIWRLRISYHFFSYTFILQMTDELNALHTDTRNFQKLQNLMIVRKQRTEQKAGFIKS